MAGAAEKRKTREAELELAFLERLRARLPRDVELLKALGDLYTRTGRYRDGLAVDELLVALCPDDALVWYNLGCSRALLGEADAAIDVLKRAVALGYRDFGFMAEDADLQSLRSDERFQALVRAGGEGAG